ncbi:MAG: efflux RND transporter periplasmic adaptor subunit [Chloroflexi bacterium]|nr:efflux RND transporter periplasmic adaptor subunit [Chloroflexota bacterium]
MKNWRTALILLLGLLLVGLSACTPSGKETEVTQPVTVKRGDISVNVSGSGSLEVSKDIKLTFGTGGKIEKIAVKEGDIVSKGQVLANLETDALKLALNQSKVGYTQAQVAVVQAELAVTQAEVAKQTVELELEKAQNIYKWPQLEVAQADVEMGRLAVKNAIDRMAAAPAEQKVEWARMVAFAEANLFLLEDKLNAMLGSRDTKEVEIKKQQVASANQSVELARQSLELSKQSLDLSKEAVDQAQKQLDETTLTAPFDGVIVDVFVDEGDVVPAPTVAPKVAFHLIDPSSMRLKIQVDEIDVANVKVGQKARIDVDALPSIKLEGKVNFIGLLPKVESGVTVYAVEIEFQVPKDVGLRVGMSASADIIISEKTNVLLVPDRAIKRDSQGRAVVEVMLGQQAEERVVTTGVSDGAQTEIIDGLKEGDVVIERRTRSATPGLF